MDRIHLSQRGEEKAGGQAYEDIPSREYAVNKSLEERKMMMCSLNYSVVLLWNKEAKNAARKDDGNIHGVMI